MTNEVIMLFRRLGIRPLRSVRGEPEYDVQEIGNILLRLTTTTAGGHCARRPPFLGVQMDAENELKHLDELERLSRLAVQRATTTSLGLRDMVGDMECLSNHLIELAEDMDRLRERGAPMGGFRFIAPEFGRARQAVAEVIGAAHDLGGYIGGLVLSLDPSCRQAGDADHLTPAEVEEALRELGVEPVGRDEVGRPKYSGDDAIMAVARWISQCHRRAE